MEQGGEERRRLWGFSEQVIGALIDVHRHLGAGLLESAYEACACHELELRGLSFERQCPMPLHYKGIQLACGYRLDLVIGGCLLVELKAVDLLQAVHTAQVITYLKLSKLPVGLLVNFNVPVLKQGLRRLWLSSVSSPPPLPVYPPLPDPFENHDPDLATHTAHRLGHDRWLFRTAAPVTSSPAIGPRGEVVVGSRDGRVYLFQ